MGSSWHLGPVLRGIRGHRAAAFLVSLQFGIGLAISVLAVLIGDFMLFLTQRPTGFAEDDLTLVELRLPGRSAGGPEAERRRATFLAAARAVPGCLGVAVVGQPPLHPLERGPDYVRRSPGDPAALAFELEGGPGLARVAGIPLRAGRDFTEQDLGAEVTAAIVSPAFASALWPGQDPVGKTFLSRGRGRAVVVGVAERMRTHDIGMTDPNVIYAHDDPRSSRTVALVRSAPGRAGEVRAALHERLAQPGQLVTVTPAAAYLHRSIAGDRAVLGIVGVMVGAMTVVVLIGSMGMAYWLVGTRTREIGLRRALGATRGDVVRHVVLQNTVFTAAGTVIGMGMVLLVLPSLIRHQHEFGVKWPLIAVTAVAVIAINLVATLIPARRAAAVPPVVVSRTV